MDALDDLVTAAEGLRDVVCSLVLYGDAVHDAAATEFAVLVVVRDEATPLDALSPALTEAMEGGVVPLIVARDELSRATDVFPVRFFDLVKRHRILLGENVVASLRFDREHLRLRCEQELRNVQMRLRRDTVDARFTDEERLIQFEWLLDGFLTALRGLWLLESSDEPIPNRDVMRKWAAKRLDEHERMGSLTDPSDLRAAERTLLAVVTHAIHVVDELAG